MSLHDDRLYLRDMLRACETIAEWTRADTFHSLTSDPIRLSAVILQLAVLGEAAAHLSSPFRTQRPRARVQTLEP